MAKRPVLPGVKKPTERQLKEINPGIDPSEYDFDDDVPIPTKKPMPIQDLPSREELLEELEAIKRKQVELDKKYIEEQEQEEPDEPEVVEKPVKAKKQKIVAEEEKAVTEEITPAQIDFARNQYIEAVEERLFESITLLKKLKQIK